MRRELYQNRKAAGLCLGTASCKRKVSTKYGLCAYHHGVRKRWLQEKHYPRLKQRYMDRKSRGLCTVENCNVPTENSECSVHIQRKKKYNQRYYSTEIGKALRSRRNRTLRLNRVKSGLCRQCTNPSVTKDMCRKHQLIKAAYNTQRNRARGAKPTTDRCSNCREVGHRYTTCTNYAVTELPETALGRRYIAAAEAELERKRKMASDRFSRKDDSEMDETGERTPRRTWNVGVRDLG